VASDKKPTTNTSLWQAHSAAPKALAAFEANFAKVMGADALVHADKVETHGYISSGSISLDYALRTGGLHRGRLIEYHGPEQAGKTTLALLAVAAAQRAYPEQVAGWVDPEGTLDTGWAVTLGVDLGRLLVVSKPGSAENVADATRMLVEGGFCSLVVLDSVGAMVPQAEIDNGASDATVGLLAKIMTRLVKQVCAMGARNGTTTLLINQQRANIAAGGNPRAAKTNRPGGFAQSHMGSVRVGLRRGGSDPIKMKIDGEEEVVAFEVAARVEKNKCAPAGPTALFWIYNRGTDTYGPAGVGLVDEAAHFGDKTGLIEQTSAGRYLIVSDGTKLHGKPALLRHLREHPDLVQEIRARALASVAALVDGSGDEDPDPQGLLEVMQGADDLD
jgi:recombination protein RecA